MIGGDIFRRLLQYIEEVRLDGGKRLVQLPLCDLDRLRPHAVVALGQVQQGRIPAADDLVNDLPHALLHMEGGVAPCEKLLVWHFSVSTDADHASIIPFTCSFSFSTAAVLN